MDFSFPRDFRITKREDFHRVYSLGTKVHGKYMVLHVLENRLPHPRLGITVSKKVGKAVVRNRWKRLIREAFRLNRHKFPSWDMVVTVRKGKKPPGFREVEEELLGLVESLCKKGISS